METKRQYLNYVRIRLASLNQRDAVASYDTGYGLHIVNVQLGPECHCMDVLSNSILKIRTPDIQGEAWFTAWDEAVKMVRKFCKGRG